VSEIFSVENGDSKNRHLIDLAVSGEQGAFWQLKFLIFSQCFCWASLNHRTLMSTPPPKWKWLSARARPHQRTRDVTSVHARIYCNLFNFFSFSIFIFNFQFSISISIFYTLFSIFIFNFQFQFFFDTLFSAILQFSSLAQPQSKCLLLLR
jgi:hypothetical protein